jgi:hypothetical protein
MAVRRRRGRCRRSSGRVSGWGWGLRRRGGPAGVRHALAFSWFSRAGGVKSNGPRPAGGRYLSVAERKEIAVGLAAGDRGPAGAVAVDGEPGGAPQ